MSDLAFEQREQLTLQLCLFRITEKDIHKLIDHLGNGEYLQLWVLLPKIDSLPHRNPAILSRVDLREVLMQSQQYALTEGLNGNDRQFSGDR